MNGATLPGLILNEARQRRSIHGFSYENIWQQILAVLAI